MFFFKKDFLVFRLSEFKFFQRKILSFMKKEKVVLVGTEDAPLFRGIFREFGITFAEDQIDFTEAFSSLKFGSPQEKVVALSREKVFRLAEKRKNAGELIVGFHAVAVFEKLELKYPQTPEEFEEVLAIIAGHIYRYCAGVSVGLVGENGQIEEFSNKLVTIFPEVKRLSQAEIKSFVGGISLDEIARSGPACRPLMGGISKLLKDSHIDVRDYENSMSQVTKRLFEDIGFQMAA